MSDKDYIKILKERDKAMPMDRHFWVSDKYKNDPPLDICGNCGRWIGDDYTFCPVCGQRIDRDNYKF